MLFADRGDDVLIESDWNLKKPNVKNAGFTPGINRIRLEFKDHLAIKASHLGWSY